MLKKMRRVWRGKWVWEMGWLGKRKKGEGGGKLRGNDNEDCEVIFEGKYEGR